MFDLNMKITGGELAEAFGKEAYLRIVPQAGSTFNGEFTVDFSSEKPLTNLRARAKGLPATVPEPTVLITFLTFGAGVLACRLRRRLTRPIAAAAKPRGPPWRAGVSADRSPCGRLNPPASTPTACRALRSRSGGLARGSGRATRRSP